MGWPDFVFSFRFVWTELVTGIQTLLMANDDLLLVVVVVKKQVVTIIGETNMETHYRLLCANGIPTNENNKSQRITGK